MERVVFLNFGGIGDEILFSPVIQAVGKAYPKAQLTLILEKRSQGIQDLLPELDEIKTVELHHFSRPQLFMHLQTLLRQGRYDAVISSGSSPFISVLLFLSAIKVRIGYDTGWLSRLFLTEAAPLNKQTYAGNMYFALAYTFLKAVGKDVSDAMVPVRPRLSLVPDEKSKLDAWLGEPSDKSRRRILVHPGVSRMSVEKGILKSWPLKYWQQLITELPFLYPEALIYLAGGPDDEEVLQSLESYRRTLPKAVQSRIINLYGKTRSLKDLAVLIDDMDMLISVDSAPMHLAIGLNKPVVALFSPTDPHKLVPDTPEVEIVFRQDLACRPCLWEHRQTSCESPVCLDIPVAQVVAGVEKVFSKS